MGKGSTARPFSVSDDEYASSFERIFRKDKQGQAETQPEEVAHGSEQSGQTERLSG
jgi:hypothetical protein